MLIQLDAVKMTEMAEQDRATRALADKDPDAMVTLPDTEESMRFMILRMFRDQISCNKYFATCRLWISTCADPVTQTRVP